MLIVAKPFADAMESFVQEVSENQNPSFSLKTFGMIFFSLSIVSTIVPRQVDITPFPINFDNFVPFITRTDDDGDRIQWRRDEMGWKMCRNRGKRDTNSLVNHFYWLFRGERWLSVIRFLRCYLCSGFYQFVQRGWNMGSFSAKLCRNSNIRATVVLPNGSITIKNNFPTKPIIIAPFVPQNRFNSGWQSINVTIWLAPAHLTDRSDRNTYDFLCQSFRNNRNLSPSSQQPRKSFHPIELIILASRLRCHRNIHAQLAVGTRTLIQCSSFALWMTITAVTATLCCWTHSFHAS